MSVHRDHRRRGIATNLLAALIHLAPAYGINRIVVETNATWKEARTLYEKSGFTFMHAAEGLFGQESFYELKI